MKPRHARLWKTTLPLAAVLCGVSSATAQLRVVSYNTLDKPIGSTQSSQFDTIFSAIAATDRNGVAKRVDIVSLQEQSRQLVSGQIVDTSQNIAARLNAIHGVGSYEARMIGAGTDRVAVVFDSSTVSLESVQSVNTTGTRPAQLARFRPVGYSSADADLYVYGAHFNASSASSRANEATGLMGDAEDLINSLGAAAANIVFAGDYNFGSSTESGYSIMTQASAVDPIDLASWPRSSVAEHMTQSTRSGNIGDGGASGGLDDRFDLQLVTDDLLDGEGVSYLGPTSTGFTGAEHSYQAFGNDGVSWNQSINNTLAGRSQSSAVINALFNFSDHLPVVADYQLPAVLDAFADAAPTTLDLGESFSLDVIVSNAADVVAAVGADELDYTLSVSGDLSGTGSGSLLALAGAESVAVGFDTSTLGLKSGTITVSTDSLGAANSLIEIPISFEVIDATGLAGDFNGDNVVDSLDYATWREGLGGDFTPSDLDVWRANYGAVATGSVATPEPLVTTPALVAAACFASRRMRRRRQRQG